MSDGAAGNDKIRELHRMRLLGILSGAWTAQACYALAALRLPDRMKEAGPSSAADLARFAEVHPVSLERLLRALVSAGLLRNPSPDTFALTPMAEFLCSDTPDSARTTALLYGEEVHQSFGEILHTVRTGRPAFEERHGRPFYEYLDDHPDTADRFNAAMGGQQELPVVPDALLDGVRTVVDIGGGNGALLGSVLAAHPDLTGVLLELPDAARQARKHLADAGLLERVRIVEGSFFDTVPAGGDLYLLSRVLHNWNDENAVRLLRHVRDTMPPDARLAVVEALLPEPGTGGKRADEARTRMVDLLMLVMLEGHDRTGAQYEGLLTTAGFRVVGTTMTAGTGAIEAVRDAG
ncbi:MAG: methyltransferase [Actinocatenispora sp.]